MQVLLQPCFEFFEGGKKSLGNIPAAERPEATTRVGILAGQFIGQ